VSGAQGIQAPIDLSIGDVLGDTDLGGMAHFEARKGKWGVFLDPAYISFSGEEKLGIFTADVDTEIGFAGFGAMYRLLERSLDAEGQQRFLFDIVGGGRYFYLTGEADVTGPFGIATDIDRDEDWVDPIVGGRIQIDINEKLAFKARGDVGGFGIGSASDFAWNVLAGFGYRLSNRTTLWLGYRIIDVDYDDGSGPDLFEYDVNIRGPMAGVEFRF
jgi:opacity protein-like surface antigen